MRVLRWLVALLLIGLGGGAAYWLYAGEGAVPPRTSASPPPIAVATAQATTGKASDTIQAFGTLTARRSVDVTAQASGQVLEVGFEQGAAVKAGDMLFRLDDTATRAALKAAQLSLDLATKDYDSMKKMADDRLVTRDQLDQAQQSYITAQSNLVTQQAALRQYIVTAPFDGYVGIGKVDKGAFVSAGQSLVTIEDRASLYVDFSVPERLLPQLDVGDAFDVTVEALPGRHFDGKISLVSPSADTTSGGISLRGEIDNGKGELRPGLYASVSLVIAERDDAVLIPAVAVVRSLAGTSVFVVADGHAKAVKVALGGRQGDLIEVTSGVAAGDRVVVMGMDKIGDGSPVTEASGS